MKHCLPILMLCLLLAACGDRTPDAPLAARAGDAVVTEGEWQAAVRELEQSTGVKLDAAARRKVLESLVQSALMSRAAEALLDAERVAELEHAVALHRQRLLVKEYLRRRADPAPVTEDRILSHYAANAAQFGGARVVHFELLTTQDAPKGEARKTALETLNALRAQTEWRTAPGENWVHRLESTANTALDSRLREAVATLSQGVVSGPLFVDGRPYLLRATRVEERAARPLAEVRGEITRRLQIEQLQQAIERAGERLLEGVEVEYFDSAD